MARQEGMFPEDKKQAVKEALEAEYEGIKEELGKVKELGGFFRLFADYCTELADLTLQNVDQIMGGNLESALFEADKLRVTLEILQSKIGSATRTRTELSPL